MSTHLASPASARRLPISPFSGGTMALTFSLVDTWDDGKRIHVAGTAAASGNYATSGDTLDLSQFPIIAATQAPVQGTAWMDGLAGYDYVFYPGSTLNNGKVKIFQQGASAGPFPDPPKTATQHGAGTSEKPSFPPIVPPSPPEGLPATPVVQVPAADLKSLYDVVQDYRACQ